MASHQTPPLAPTAHMTTVDIANVERVYDEEASVYHFTAPFTADRAAGLMRYTAIGNNSSVLDLGCGPRLLLLDPRKYTTGAIFGVDISRNMVDLAKQRIRDAGFTSGPGSIAVLKDNIQTLSSVGTLLRERCPSGFDFIFATSVLSHFGPEQERQAFRLWKTFLARGGKIIAHRWLYPLAWNAVFICTYEKDDISDIHILAELEFAPEDLHEESRNAFKTFVDSVGGLEIINAVPIHKISPRLLPDGHADRDATSFPLESFHRIFHRILLQPVFPESTPQQGLLRGEEYKRALDGLDV